MASFFTNSTVTILRKVSSGVSSLGTPIYNQTTIASNLKCCIVEDSSVVEYSPTGQVTVSDFYFSYRGKLDLKSEDVIVDQLGEKYTVIGKPYKGVTIEHVEAFLKLGVEV